MGRRAIPLGPLAASLLGHAVLIAALTWRAAGLADPGVVPLRPDPAAPTAPRLQLRSLTGEPPAAAGEAVVALDTADPRYRPYLLGVKRRIWERWQAPELEGEAPRGALVVEFTLSRSGRLATAGVREPSGHPALDRAALAAVRRAVPFAPFPVAIAADTLRVRARFVYD